MDKRVQNSVITGLSARPEVVEAGPFVIGWDPGTEGRFINYATPRLGATIKAADVAALVTAFREIDRIPRLEYVTSCAPGLEALLLDAGFAVEEQQDYLICTPATLAEPGRIDGFDLLEPSTDEQRAAQLAVQNEAFGGEPTATPSDVARVRGVQEKGGVMMAVRGPDGTLVAGGQATAPGDGVSEVAGIAVAEPFRRRGIAGLLTAGITARLFASGAEVAWLEASGEDSWRVYERVGYVPTGKRLYIALD
jgi:ribosomal protein S18 acetylase RimI-like enzyme